MSTTDPEAERERVLDQMVRVLGASEPDWMNCHPDETLRRVMGEDRDTGEDGAPMRVAAPHEPSPRNSAIALPLPVEGESD